MFFICYNVLAVEMRLLNIGVSPSGKAEDSDSSIPWVQILPPQPYLDNKIDVHPLNRLFRRFFGILEAKNHFDKNHHSIPTVKLNRIK